MLFVGRLFMAMSLSTNVGKDVHGGKCSGIKESSKLLRVVEKRYKMGESLKVDKREKEMPLDSTSGQSGCFMHRCVDFLIGRSK